MKKIISLALIMFAAVSAFADGTGTVTLAINYTYANGNSPSDGANSSRNLMIPAYAQFKQTYQVVLNVTNTVDLSGVPSPGPCFIYSANGTNISGSVKISDDGTNVCNQIYGGDISWGRLATNQLVLTTTSTNTQNIGIMVWSNKAP